MLDNKMRYIYFGQKKDNTAHNGVVCVGYKLTDDGKAIDMGFAFCSPQNRFSKKKAHLIVTGRVHKDDFIKFDNVTAETKYEKIVDMAKKALNAAMPKDVVNVREYVKARNFKEYPSIAKINLPWWFAGV